MISKEQILMNEMVSVEPLGNRLGGGALSCSDCSSLRKELAPNCILRKVGEIHS